MELHHQAATPRPGTASETVAVILRDVLKPARSGRTPKLISAVLASRPHPEQGFRTCLGILRSYRGLDPVRVEAVIGPRRRTGRLNCKGVASLLARKPVSAAAKDSRPATLFDHANLRGPGYYH